MISIALCAILCAVASIALIAPIAHKHQRLSYALMMAIPCVALGLYMLLGAPGLPSRPALFDTDESRAQARAMAREELEAMKAVSQSPDDVMAYMRLAGLRIGQGKFDEAIDLLTNAIALFPEDDNLKMQRGAAIFAKGILHAENGELPQALLTLQDALDKTPPTAPFYADIQSIINKIESLKNNPAPHTP